MSDPRVDRLLLQLSQHAAPDSMFTRERAAKVLGEMREARATEPLIEALRDETWPVVAAAAEALGAIGDREAVLPLIASLEGTITLGQEKAVVQALGNLRDVRALEILIRLLLRNHESREKMGADYFGNLSVILTALQQIAGLDLGDDPSGWDRWWRESHPS